ncbi:hypothetical protein ACWGJ2_33630 [Streptomyces sp. NPDC054796]
MGSQEATSPYPPHPWAPDEAVGVEQAEAALVEHYPRLVRLGYLVLPPSLGRHRRVLAAHALAQRALPRGRTTTRAILTQRAPGEALAPRETPGTAQAAFAWIRLRVLRAALAAERPRRLGPWQPRALRALPPLPAPLPRVFGLRLFPRSGGADELALDQALSAVSGAARAVYVLRGLEGMADHDIRSLLRAADVPDPDAALAGADRVVAPAGSRDQSLLESVEFDPCSLQARPTDLMRRRQHARAAVAVAVAALVGGGLLGLPGDSWGPDGPAAPPYARNATAERALDPDALARAAPTAWRDAARLDFAAWPARGDRLGDRELLRRALAVWARPGPEVSVSTTRGTPAGPPSGPPRLLYAGTVDGARVVLLHDGLRVARYAESAGAERGGAALDLARTDGADEVSAGALVVSRSDSNVRYLTAPWVAGASTADLLRPSDAGHRVEVGGDGVTAPLPAPPTGGRDCARWPGLLLDVRGRSAPYLYSDLGELTPARLTDGAPGAGPEGSRGTPADATGAAARTRLAHGACRLPALAGHGVRSVNTWRFAEQPLPGPGQPGTADWLCTRAETWRGQGARAAAVFRAPAREPSEPGAAASPAVGGPACGPREPRVLGGVMWRSRDGDWYVLAAGSEEVTSVTATGDVRGTEKGRTLALRAAKGSRTRLVARLADGTSLQALR